MKKNRGFTLIEILITLLVFGILAVVSINVGLSSIKRASFNAAFNRFIADFYYTRQVAAQENRYAAIIFNNNGQSYDIVVQKNIQTPPTADVNTYVHNKTVFPMDGEEFFDGSNATNFAFNSTGIVRAFPVNINSTPIQVSLTFFKKSRGSKVFQKTIRVYPSGGIKIEDIK